MIGTRQYVSQLVDELTFDGDSRDEATVMRGNITRLCGTDETFASEAIRLVRETSPMARYTLHSLLKSYQKVSTARSVSASISTSVFSYSAPQYILDSTVISAEMYAYYAERGGDHDLQQTQAAHQLMVKADPLRPKLSKVSRLEASLYSVSLAAAASILGTKLQLGIAVNEPLVKKQAKPFIDWASESDDFDLVITTALRIGSLEPKSIEALNEIFKSTHGSLSDGVI